MSWIFTNTSGQQKVSSEYNTNATPVGSIIAFAGTTAPSGWLFANGALVNRADYPELFQIIGTSYNTGGEAATQFRVPNMAGRVPAGLDVNQADFNALGKAAGAASVTLTSQQSGMRAYGGYGNQAEMLAGVPTLRWMKSGYNTNIINYNDQHVTGTPADAGGTYADVAGIPGGAHRHYFSIPAMDAAAGHNNLQPYVTVNYIIRWDGSTRTVTAAPVQNVTTVTSAYTVTSSNSILLLNSSAAAFTVTLPATHAAGTVFEFKDSGGSAGTNNITISGNGSLIDGVATFVMNINREAIRIVSNGTAWSVL